MTLKQFVKNQGGVVPFSKKLGCTPNAVRMWLRRENHPNINKAVKIAKMSRGKLTIIDILQDTSR